MSRLFGPFSTITSNVSLGVSAQAEGIPLTRVAPPATAPGPFKKSRRFPFPSARVVMPCRRGSRAGFAELRPTKNEQGYGESLKFRRFGGGRRAGGAFRWWGGESVGRAG